MPSAGLVRCVIRAAEAFHDCYSAYVQDRARLAIMIADELERTTTTPLLIHLLGLAATKFANPIFILGRPTLAPAGSVDSYRSS